MKKWLTGRASRTAGVSWRDWALLLVLIAVFVPATRHAWLLFESDWMVLKARQQLRDWSRPAVPMQVPEWVQARNSTQQALALTPDNPTLHDLLAALYSLRARQSTAGSAFANGLYEQAAQHQRAALALRPGHGWTWAGLAESLLAIQPSSTEGWQAWRTAQQKAPHEIQVIQALFFIAQRAGTQAPADVQQWIRDMQRTAPSRLRKAIGLPNTDTNAPKP